MQESKIEKKYKDRKLYNQEYYRLNREKVKEYYKRKHHERKNKNTSS